MSSRLLDALVDRPAAWRFIASFAAERRSPWNPATDTTPRNSTRPRHGSA